MAWTLFEVPVERRAELDSVLHDDLVCRQSQKLRDAAAAGGPSGQVYVLIEGSAEAITKAESLLTALGRKLAPADAGPLYQRFRDEDEAASEGMGLFFTE